FVICNNERQRDAWLGMLQSLGLITGEVYDRDHTLRRLVAVAPHGIRPDERATRDDEEAARSGEGATGNGEGDSPESPQPSALSAHPSTVFSRAFPAIRPTDRVLLWNAGIVGWYDPVTAI